MASRPLLKGCITESLRNINIGRDDVAVALQLILTSNSDVSMPLMRGGKWMKKYPCFSEASFGDFPFFDLQQREPR